MSASHDGVNQNWLAHRSHHGHPLPATTHTVEMSQLSELNRLLPSHPPLTAADLGLEGRALQGRRDDHLPGTAILTRVSWHGSPEFPDIYGHFSAPGSAGAALVIDLHTTALRLLSRRLAARHLWGVGISPPTRGARPIAP